MHLSRRGTRGPDDAVSSMLTKIIQCRFLFNGNCHSVCEETVLTIVPSNMAIISVEILSFRALNVILIVLYCLSYTVKIS